MTWLKTILNDIPQIYTLTQYFYLFKIHKRDIHTIYSILIYIVILW